MLIFRAIFSILFAPIRILGNLFQHKDNLLEWHLYYTGLGLRYTSVRISSKYKEQVPADGLLISSYILFLARYFFICDERQTDNIRKCLKQEIGNQNYNPKELSVQIYNTIYDTLNSREQKVVGELFYKGTPPFPLSILASGYSEGGEPTNSYAKYSFLVFEHKGNIADNFHMSHGPDIVLLPITVGILYDYVIDRLSDKNNKKNWILPY